MPFLSQETVHHVPTMAFSSEVEFAHPDKQRRASPPKNETYFPMPHSLPRAGMEPQGFFEKQGATKRPAQSVTDDERMLRKTHPLALTSKTTPPRMRPNSTHAQ
jgi:hypothetical protein